MTNLKRKMGVSGGEKEPARDEVNKYVDVGTRPKPVNLWCVNGCPSPPHHPMTRWCALAAGASGANNPKISGTIGNLISGDVAMQEDGRASVVFDERNAVD